MSWIIVIILLIIIFIINKNKKENEIIEQYTTQLQTSKNEDHAESYVGKNKPRKLLTKNEWNA